jgi:protein ImuB
MFACIYSKSVPAGASLSGFAYAFSPLVEETAEDTMVLDVEGCELLFGSAYELGNEIVRRATRSKQTGGLGCRVNVAIAVNPDAAILAARSFKGLTFISPGEELTGLGDLSIEVLLSPRSNVQGPTSLSSTANSQTPTPNKQTLDVGLWTLDLKRWQEILDTLRLWGVRTLREFAALPVTGVSERLGQEGVKLQQLASGKIDRQLKLKQPAPVFADSIELEYPLFELEPLSFILARLLNQLCAKLHAYALATNELQVLMKLEDGTSHDRKLNLPYAMRDHKVFLKLLLLDAEMHPPQSAVVALSLSCEPVKPRVAQNGLFIPLAPEPEKLELTLARLAKLVGPANIGSPELLDTHRPDAFRVKRFALTGKVHQQRRKRSEANGQSAIGNRQCRLAFRVFRPPLRALVESAKGYPTRISAWSSDRSVHGKLVRVAGPWRTSGDWWRTDSWARDEWDVAVESRASMGEHTGQPLQILCRIYRELRSGAWFVEGVYD